MTTYKMREEFEATYGIPWLVRAEVCKCWERAWNASRASLVIDLPAEYELPPTMDLQTLVNACRQQDADAIEAAGLKVKS